MERLDKYLANAGVGTRSEVKKYVKAGRVCVNGGVCKNSDLKIDPEKDQITFDNQPLFVEKFEYYMLYKPSGCVTATKDNVDQTVMDYVESDRKEKMFPVGRLDKDTEGLLLITDDGELAHRLLAPRKHVSKRYEVIVTGYVTEEDVIAFEQGIDIGDDKPTLPAQLEVEQASEQESHVYVTISEGRFHQIKRMFRRTGHEVTFLKRLQMGPLRLDQTLKPGECRKLTSEEITLLTAAR